MAVIFHTRERDGFANRLNPLTKLVMLLEACIILSSADGTIATALALAIAALALVQHLPLRLYASEGIVFIILALFIFISDSLTTGTVIPPLISSFRFLMTVLASLLFIDCTQIGDLAQSLSWLLRPVFGSRAASFASTIQLTLSMIPMIFDNASQIAEARKARGASFIRHPLRSSQELALGLVSGLLESVDERADALLSRSYNPANNTWAPPFSWRDALGLVICLIPLGGFLWTRMV